MYVFLEYLTSLLLLAFLAGVLFAGAVALLMTMEGAKRLTAASRQLADQAVRMADSLPKAPEPSPADSSSWTQ